MADDSFKIELFLKTWSIPLEVSSNSGSVSPASPVLVSLVPSAWMEIELSGYFALERV